MTSYSAADDDDDDNNGDGGDDDNGNDVLMVMMMIHALVQVLAIITFTCQLKTISKLKIKLLPVGD